jgi:uncharacterized membrane protein YedE/YeeE
MITIDWLHFTPASAFAGGLLIGLAAALLILLEGRIAGISGIVGGLLQPLRKGDVAWRMAFALGLVAAPLLYRALAELPQSRIDAGWATLVVAGLLVGFGSRLGSGCTSGHGVCGLSRRSPRSLVATIVFMTAGFATAFAGRHLFA